MYDRIDIGNVRGIRGEKGDKGEKGRTPTYDDLKYKKVNDEFVTLITNSEISQSQYYIDANKQLCNSEGYLIDSEGDVTNIIGEVPYEQLWVDEQGRFTNSKGELLDEYYNVQYIESDLINDFINGLYDDKPKWYDLIEKIYPHITDELISADPNDERFSTFFDEIEGDIKYYICEDNPKTHIYIEDNTLVNTCKYLNENGSIATNTNGDYVYVPLEKNTLYLYNPSGLTDNDIMHYDIYVCTKYNTIPKKLVSANDFIINYNIIDDILLDVQENNIREENDIFLKTLIKGSGQFYTVEDVDTLFTNNLINKLGANNGIAQLNSNGKVPNSQLPAYVDDVIEGTMNNNETTFTPLDNNYIDSVQQTGKIYVDTTTRKTYRWSGSGYIFISNPIVVDDGTTNAYGSANGQALETKIGNNSLNTTTQTITGAINEHEDDISTLNTNKQDKTDNSLNTTVKTITGAINELDNKKSDNTHSHGELSNSGTLDSNTNIVNKIVVTDSNDNLKTIDILPANKVTHQDISGKVDKETGKGLSSNDYTTAEKNKLARLREIQLIEDINEVDGDGIFFLVDEELNVYTISLDSDKDIIQTGELVTLTATLKKNNLPLSGKEILFDGSTNKENVVTDSNGKATYTYTGVGRGVVNISASWNMVLQETYEVLDCQFYDIINDNTYQKMTKVLKTQTFFDNIGQPVASGGVEIVPDTYIYDRTDADVTMGDLEEYWLNDKYLPQPMDSINHVFLADCFLEPPFVIEADIKYEYQTSVEFGFINLTTSSIMNIPFNLISEIGIPVLFLNENDIGGIVTFEDEYEISPPLTEGDWLNYKFAVDYDENDQNYVLKIYVNDHQLAFEDVTNNGFMPIDNGVFIPVLRGNVYSDSYDIRNLKCYNKSRYSSVP